MKKIVLALALLGTAGIAQAQVQIGPKVGITVATMDLGQREDKDPSGTGSILGATLGVAANIAISDMFSFAPELSYAQRGYSYASAGQRGTIAYTAEERFRTNYLDMPLLLRATFGNTVKMYANAGPTLGYWLNGRYTGEGIETTNGESVPYSYNLSVKFVDEYKDIKTEEFVEVSKEHANRFEVGASFGGGLMLPLAGSKLLIDARYTLALKDVYNALPENARARNRVLSLSAIYLFGK